MNLPSPGVKLPSTDWELVVEALALLVLGYRECEYEKAEQAWSVVGMVEPG